MEKCSYGQIVNELQELLASVIQRTNTLEVLKEKYNNIIKKNTKFLDDNKKELDQIFKSFEKSNEKEIISGLDNLISAKISTKDLENIRLKVDYFSNTFDFFDKRFDLTAASIIEKYDASLIDEINLFQTLYKEGIGGQKGLASISKIYNKTLDKIEKIFKKNGFSDETINILESKISESTYNSIHAKIGKDGFVERKFNLGYTKKQLDTYIESLGDIKDKEQLIKEWKLKNRGFIDYFEGILKDKVDLFRVDDSIINEIEQELSNLGIGVIEGVTNHLDEVQKALGNKELNFYGGYGMKHTFLKDIINAYIGDPQFVLKKRVFKHKPNKDELFDYFRKKYEEVTGETVEYGSAIESKIQNDAYKIYDTFIARKEDGLRKFLKNLMGISYLFKYGRLSFGYGHISMAMQFASNFFEYSSVYKQFTNEDIHKINLIEQKVGNIGEDTFSFGAGLDRERLDGTRIDKLNKMSSNATKSFVESITKRFGIDNFSSNRIANIVDMAVFEPMMLDGLSDYARQKVAIYKIYKKFGDEIFNIDENRLRSLIKSEYARLGGSVLSSSPLYRETKLTMINPEKSGYAFKSIFMDHFRFLRGWAISKTLNFGEVWMNGIKAIELLGSNKAGDIILAKQHLKEFVGFNLYLIQAILNSMVLYARVQKSNNLNEEDRVGAEDFTVGMTNQLVAFDILLGNEIKNIKELVTGTGGDGYLTQSQQATITTLSFLKKITNFYKEAGLPKIIYDYLKYKPGDYVGAVLTAREKIYAGGLRYGQQLQDKYLNGVGMSKDPVSILGVSPLTKQQIADSDGFDFRKNLKYIDGDTGLFMGIYDMFKGYISPSDFYVKDKVAQDKIKKIVTDKGLRQLYLGSAIDYDLEKLYLDNPDAITELYKQLGYKGIGYSLDENLYKSQGNINKDNDSGYKFDLIDRYITDLAKSKGLDINDIIKNRGGKNKVYGKLISMLQIEGPEKTKYIVPYLIEKTFKEYRKNFTKQYGYYAETEDIIKLKYKAIKDNIELFDINNEAKRLLAQAHIDTYLKDEFKNDDYKHSLKKMINSHLDNVLLATANLKDSGTDVSYLTSRIRVNLEGIIPKTEKGKEYYANYVLKSLVRTEFSSLPEKEKVARQAAFLLGMTKEGSDIMNNYAAFEGLSKKAKVLLANWYYRTHDKMNQYTTEILGGHHNNKKFRNSGYYKKYYKNKGYYPLRFKRGYGTGQRPGFNKQFPERIPLPLHKYINPDYNPIIQHSLNHYRPLPVRPLRLPLLDEIKQNTLRIYFKDIYSKDLFKGIKFKTGEPIKRNMRKNKIQYRNIKTKKRFIRKTRKGKQYLNKSGASYVELVGKKF